MEPDTIATRITNAFCLRFKEITGMTEGNEDKSMHLERQVPTRGVSQGEATLRELANLLDLTHDAILVRDMNRVIKYWNQGAEKLYGWAAEEAVDSAVYDLLKTVFPTAIEQIEEEVLCAVGTWGTSCIAAVLRILPDLLGICRGRLLVVCGTSVGGRPLDLRIGIRIPASQPINFRSSAPSTRSPNDDKVSDSPSEEVELARTRVDVVGIGLNATDTVLEVREFPALGGKERVVASSIHAGGQVATALVTCCRLGLSARYIGKVGDDAAGRMQLASLRREGLELKGTRIVRGVPNQYAFIIVDQKTGERTVFWDRDAHLAVKPGELSASSITSARLLHVDGCDLGAALRAADWARRAGLPVAADLDTAYKNVEKLFPCVDYLIASTHFLPAVTGHADPFKVLEYMAREYRIRMPGMTLGRDGALVLHAGRFIYSPGYVVETVDTTGAGDVFHGAFDYALLAGWDTRRALDFSNAMAALNCTALGARGGIKSRAEAERLMATAQRRVNPAYEQRRARHA